MSNPACPKIADPAPESAPRSAEAKTAGPGAAEPAGAESAPGRVPFDATLQVRDSCLCLHAQRAARALARRFDDALRPHGLTNGQFSLLMSLNRPAPAPLGAIAQFLAMDRTTLTAALKPLARDGLLTVQPNPDDRRSRLLSLTPAGHAALLRALPAWRAEHAALEQETGAEDIAALRGLLQQLG